MLSYDEQRRDVVALLTNPKTAQEGALLDIPKNELLDEILYYIRFNGYVVRSVEDGTKSKIEKW